MVEDILTNKRSYDDDIKKKNVEVSKVLTKNLNSIKRQADREGISVSNLIKMLRSE